MIYDEIKNFILNNFEINIKIINHYTDDNFDYISISIITDNEHDIELLIKKVKRNFKNAIITSDVLFLVNNNYIVNFYLKNTVEIRKHKIKKLLFNIKKNYKNIFFI
jgi:hypothetical protein